MPKEDNIFGAFTECLLVPLEGVPTYEYMKILNFYLNSYVSPVYSTLECGTLGYLVLTAQPDLFSTYCGTLFLPPTNPGIHLVMPDPASTAAIFPNLSEHTGTDFVCFINIARPIQHVRRSSVI